MALSDGFPFESLSLFFDFSLDHARRFAQPRLSHPGLLQPFASARSGTLT